MDLSCFNEQYGNYTEQFTFNMLAQSNDFIPAKELVEAVDEIAKIFWATKGVDYSDPNADVRFGA